MVKKGGAMGMQEASLKSSARSSIEKKREAIKAILVEQLDEVKEKLSGIDLSFESTEVKDDVEQATQEYQIASKARQMSRQTYYFKKLKKALAHISSEDFGICEDCGSDISLNRLKARPTAELCLKCKEEQESEESRVVYKRKSHSLGKTLKEAVS